MLSDGHLLFYTVLLCTFYSVMDEKLDKLLKSIDDLKSTQWQNQWDTTAKLDCLEQDIVTGQEETLQLVAKKMKCDPDFQFRWKGNKKQFTFNEAINDSIQSAVAMLEKVKPTTAQETAALKSAKEQLKLDTKAIVECQKLIRLADRLEHGWQLVEAYQQDKLADSNKDAKRIEKAEKVVELKNRWKCKQVSDKEKMDPQPSDFRPQQFSGSFGFPPPVPFMPLPFNQPVPIPQPAGPAVRVPGPCFQCLQIGYLKAHCLNKINKQ